MTGGLDFARAGASASFSPWRTSLSIALRAASSKSLFALYLDKIARLVIFARSGNRNLIGTIGGGEWLFFGGFVFGEDFFVFFEIGVEIIDALVAHAHCFRRKSMTISRLTKPCGLPGWCKRMSSAEVSLLRWSAGSICFLRIAQVVGIGVAFEGTDAWPGYCPDKLTLEKRLGGAERQTMVACRCVFCIEDRVGLDHFSFCCLLDIRSCARSCTFARRAFAGSSRGRISRSG